MKGVNFTNKLLLISMGVLAVNPVPAFADSFGWDDEGGSSKTEQSQEASSDFLKGFDEFMSAKDGNYKASEDVSYNTQKSTAVHYSSDSYHPQDGFDISHGGNAVRYYENGQMKKGWVDNGYWYHFNETDGTMDRNKWIEDGGKWYYLQANGAMARNVYVDGYYLDSKTGEMTDNVPEIALEHHPVLDSFYVLGHDNFSTEEFNKGVDNGTIQPTVTHPNGKTNFTWKYVGDNQNTSTVDSGVSINSYHPQDGFDVSHGGNAVRYYENGQMKKGWVDNGVWYHFNDTDGTMDRNKWVEDNGKWYYMGANGMMARNVYVDGYYLNNSGEITDDVPARALAKKPTYTRVAGVINSGVVSMSIEEFNKGVDNGTIQPVITHPNGKVSFDWKYVG